eukprot:UN25772
MYYDSSRMTGHQVWTYYTGTVLASPSLWVKVIFLWVIVVCGALFSYAVLVQEKLELNALNDFLVGLEALLAFFAGLYVEGAIGRWWTMRQDGIGRVTNAICDLCVIVAGLCHGDEAKENNIRNVVIRYGLLSHALLYYQGQTRSFQNKEDADRVWDELSNRALVTKAEERILKDSPKKFSTVWVWVLTYMQQLIEAEQFDDRFEQITEICREARRAGGCCMLHIDCQLPLPYVHLICLMTNLY